MEAFLGTDRGFVVLLLEESQRNDSLRLTDSSRFHSVLFIVLFAVVR